MMTPKFTDYQHRLQEILTRYLTQPKIPLHLSKAIQYSVNGGKRIRPLLVYCTGYCFGSSPEKLDIPAIAVELIHAYSLVHDDLPAMDDDDFRRGQPSCHRAFDEATAILVGDALQSLAFELIAMANGFYSASQQIKMVSLLAQAIGAQGMVGGQMLDIQNKTADKLSDSEYDYMNQLKTGQLIRASIQLGAIASGCEDENMLKKLDDFGQLFGLAFQVKDDLDDIAQDFSERKTISKDSSQLTLEAVKTSQSVLEDLYTQALHKLSEIKNSSLLKELTIITFSKSS